MDRKNIAHIQREFWLSVQYRDPRTSDLVFGRTNLGTHAHIQDARNIREQPTCPLEYGAEYRQVIIPLVRGRRAKKRARDRARMAEFNRRKALT